VITEGRRQGLLGYDEDAWGDDTPSWERRRAQRLLMDFYGALCAAAAEARPEPPLSLATCEKVPRIGGADRPSADCVQEDSPETKAEQPDTLPPTVPPHDEESGTGEDGPGLRLDGKPAYLGGSDAEPNQHVETAADLERMPVALEAIRASIERSRERQRKVLALIQAGEAVHARRLATCRRKSVQMECPDDFGAGGCGSRDNYVPVNCDSRLCPECMKRKMGEKAGQYTPTVDDWDHPTMLRLSLDRRVDPADVERAVDALRGAHGRLRKRKIPPSGDGWSWSEWKRSLRMVGRADLARRWQKRYVDRDRWIPVAEAIPTGFYGIDIKQGRDRTLNVHMHLLADVPWLPQAALSALWDDLTDAPVVDIRRVDGSEEGALMEVVGYAAKAPEYEEIEDQVAYLKTLKGSKLIQPFGDLHGNTPPCAAALLCGDCGRTPKWWNYVGTVDGEYSTMEVIAVDGDRPPPDA